MALRAFRAETLGRLGDKAYKCLRESTEQSAACKGCSSVVTRRRAASSCVALLNAIMRRYMPNSQRVWGSGGMSSLSSSHPHTSLLSSRLSRRRHFGIAATASITTVRTVVPCMCIRMNSASQCSQTKFKHRRLRS